jgi:hypothetical protein
MLTEAAGSPGQAFPNGALAGRDQSRGANERMKWTMKRQDHRIYALVEEIFASGDPWTLTDLGIKVYVKRVLASLEVLVACFNEIENRKIRSHAFKGLEELLAMFSEIVDNFYNLKLAKTKQAYVARSAKRRKAAQRYNELVECIKAEAKTQRRTLSTGIKFAQLMRPGVRRRLGLDPEGDGWPSASTIKAAIKILKSTSKESSGQDLKK